MTQGEKFRFEMMGTPELALECQNLKSDMRYHLNEKRRCKDGGNPEKFHFHQKEYHKAENMHAKLDAIIQSRQLTLF